LWTYLKHYIISKIHPNACSLYSSCVDWMVMKIFIKKTTVACYCILPQGDLKGIVSRNEYFFNGSITQNNSFWMSAECNGFHNFCQENIVSAFFNEITY
jgi:hypothetical protein